MLQMVKQFAVVVAALLFAGCNTLDIRGLVAPTGDVVNNRFQSSMSLNGGESIATVEATESYMFYVAADPHIGYPYDAGRCRRIVWYRAWGLHR